MPKKRRRSRRIPMQAYQEIHRIVREGGVTNATEVYRAVLEKFPDKAPSERTVRDIVRELLPPDPSGPWQPGPDDDPEDAARVLAAMAEVTARAKGEPRWRLPSRERARWIAWVLAGWPDLDPVVAAVLATDYWARRSNEQETYDLDAFLAFAPWRSEEAYHRFQQLTERGGVPSPPAWYWTAAAVQNMRRHLKAGDQPVLEVEVSEGKWATIGQLTSVDVPPPKISAEEGGVNEQE